MAPGQLLAEVEAAGPLQPHVEEDDVGFDVGGQPQRLGRFGGGAEHRDPVPLRRQHRHQPLEHDLVVVDEERGGRARVCHRRFHPGILPPSGPGHIPRRDPPAGDAAAAARP